VAAFVQTWIQLFLFGSLTVSRGKSRKVGLRSVLSMKTVIRPFSA